jgi:hypothetical protein
MTLTLALSILQFGSFPSSPWLQDEWGTDDIYIFYDEGGRLVSNEARSCTTPMSLVAHTSAFIEKTSSRPTYGNILASNMQLFSLARVLTELAFGKTLTNIECPRIDPSSGDNSNAHSTTQPQPTGHIVEYLKLRDIVDTQLRYEVNLKFALAVKACFNFDFVHGERDLSKRKTQEQYYEKVVKKLEELVKTLDAN